MIDSLIKFGDHFGFPALCVLLFAFMLWKLASWGYIGLFHPDTGILTQWYKRQAKFLDGLDQRDEGMAVQLVATAAAQQSQAEATQSLKRAFSHHADAMIDIAETINPELGKRVRDKMGDLKRELGTQPA